MKKSKKTAADILFFIGMAVLLVIFIGSAVIFFHQKRQDIKQQAEFDALRAGVLQAEREQEIPADSETETGAELSREKRLDGYAVLHEQNQDMVGWVSLEGTSLDYPVMWTPKDRDYYLHRNFEKKYSGAGVPYLDGNCRWQEPQSNFLIYGHHMKNGSLFAVLDGYEKQDFYEQHQFILFDTLEKTGKYEVAAVFLLSGTGDEVPWRALLFSEDIEEFNKAWKEICRIRFYETDVEVSREDHLLALVTCEYTQKDGRLMVIAKEADT